MTAIEPVYVGPHAIAEAQRFCRRYADRTMVLVADTNTYAAAGQALNDALQRARLSVHAIILTGDHIHADDTALGRVLAHSPRGDALFIAVGSGTVTDITRYISYRLGMPFVSLPTAASVDGYASPGAPLVIEGIKSTHHSQPPLAIFADIDVIRRAPPRLTAAGVGDMLAKTTSTADWRLGRLLWDEPYDDTIAERSLTAARECIDSVDEIATQSESGLRRLMDALAESGLCMLDFGDSRPASGAEHHISHLWEMFSLRDGGRQPLHGEQVGVATILAARLYARLRELTRVEVERMLTTSRPVGRAEQIAEIEAAYGALAPSIVSNHAAFLEMTNTRYTRLCRAVITQWDHVQALAAGVPAPQQLEQILRRVGGPTTTAQLGFPELQVRAGVVCGHYLRERFTVIKLARLLGLSVYPL
ncbi:MAG: sn-glycerol-1-phosphate dehydrogenase [Spirochaetaceae bacterium]|nr:MAG: sn-glycerol-1-phosphate dehydrogenase [Spirochaetaceae bacterium]